MNPTMSLPGSHTTSVPNFNPLFAIVKEELTVKQTDRQTNKAFYIYRQVGPRRSFIPFHCEILEGENMCSPSASAAI